MNICTHRKQDAHGFTMAELLIVVAIVAVLVAIAIPVFTAQLEKSREAVDLANMRNAYASVRAAFMNGETLRYTYKDLEGHQQEDSQTFGVDTVGCVFDASNGKLVSMIGYQSVSGYGKGTSQKGGCETSSYCRDSNWDNYSESSDVAGMLIAMTVLTDGSIEMYWYPAYSS